MVFGVSVFSCRGERTKIVALLLLRIAWRSRGLKDHMHACALEKLQAGVLFTTIKVDDSVASRQLSCLVEVTRRMSYKKRFSN